MDGHSTQGHGRSTGVKCQYRTSQLHALGQSLNFLGPVISHLGQGSNPSPRRVKIKRDDMCNAKARPRLVGASAEYRTALWFSERQQVIFWLLF